MNKLLYYITVFFFPERCPYCSKLVEPYEYACESCLQKIAQKHQPIKSGVSGFRCISSFPYGGKVRRIILRIKYYEGTQFIPQLAVILAQDIRNSYDEDSFDVITAVPMHEKDYLKREFNQSELLAKELGKLLSVPYAETLLKVKRTKKQHTLKYNERKKNLSGAFELKKDVDLKGKRILLVDDIITSGYTLANCCKKLDRAKPSQICCATIASAKDKFPESTVI